jgi:hypothetical protein
MGLNGPVATEEEPERGTLVIAALLLLALGFAGYWIVSYLRGEGPPWSSLVWFGSAAVAIVVLGFLAGMLPGQSHRR